MWKVFDNINFNCDDQECNEFKISINHLLMTIYNIYYDINKYRRWKVINLIIKRIE